MRAALAQGLASMLNTWWADLTSAAASHVFPVHQAVTILAPTMAQVPQVPPPLCTTLGLSRIGVAVDI